MKKQSDTFLSLTDSISNLLKTIHTLLLGLIACVGTLLGLFGLVYEWAVSCNTPRLSLLTTISLCMLSVGIAFLIAFLLQKNKDKMSVKQVGAGNFVFVEKGTKAPFYCPNCYLLNKVKSILQHNDKANPMGRMKELNCHASDCNFSINIPSDFLTDFDEIPKSYQPQKSNSPLSDSIVKKDNTNKFSNNEQRIDKPKANDATANK